MQNNFENLESKPATQFFSYAIPAILGMLLTSGIVIIDGLFIGNIIGKEGLASVNLTLPVFYLFLGTTIMIGVGGAVKAGHALGAENYTQASRHFTSTIVLAVIVISVLTLLCFLFIDPLLGKINTSQVLSRFVKSYLGTILWFYPVIMINIVFSIFIRAQGKPGLALIFDLVGNGLNIVLDYFMIARWGLGLQGAALASGISVIVPMGCGLLYFLSGRSILRFVKFSWNWQVMAQILFNGSSEMMGQLSVGFTTWVFNLIILSRMGIDGVAAYTIVGYVAFVQIMVVTGFAIGLGPLIGYSFGAGKTDHIKRIMNIALISGFITGIICWGVVLFSSTTIAASFSRGSENIINFAESGFSLFAAAFLLNGFNILITTYFTSIGKAGISFIIASLRGLLLINGFVLILPRFMGDAGIWISYPLSELMTLGFALMFLKKSYTCMYH
jgi:putative MATE family efflux protein